MCSPGDRVERSLATFAFTSANQGSGLNGRFAVIPSWGIYLYRLQLFGRRPGSRTPRLLVLSETDFPVFLVAHINLGPVSTLNLLRSWVTFTFRPDLELCTLEVGVRVERTNNCFAGSSPLPIRFPTVVRPTGVEPALNWF